MKESLTLPVQGAEPAEPVNEPKPEQRPNGAAQIDRSFAHVPVASGSGNDERLEALHRLLRDIAGKLGIRAGQIEVRMGSDADILAGSRNANGVARNGVVYLRSASFDPESRNGRGLLAHEAAHVAQSLLSGADLEPPEETRAPAEIEAAAFAERYSETRTGNPVKVPLPPSAVAADKDFDALVATVKHSRSAEIARIIDLLSYGVFDWAITGGDVFDVLHILGMYSLPVARAIARNIGDKYRKRFFSNLNPPHYKAYRAHILAVCWAAESESEFASENYQILNYLELFNLESLELLAVNYVVNLSPKIKQATTADPKRAARITEAQEFAKSEKGQAAGKEELDKAKKEEQAEEDARKKAEEAAKKDKSLDGLVKRIKSKLDELWVTDKEALELLDVIADQCLPFGDPSDRFRALAAGLGSKYLDELINQIPAKGLYQTERRRKTYVYLVATRPPFKNEQIAENLMSSPWWQFWDTVTSEEAFLAYLLVKSMPERARNAFLKARGGEKWNRVIDELPRNIRESATFNFYQGGAGEKDRQSLLAALIDDQIWTAAQKDKLDATIRMARAAGESQFVFEQSKVHCADQIRELKFIVDKYQLYVEGQRTQYVEKPLEGHAWYEEGIFATFSKIWHGLVLLFGLRNVQLLGEKLAADVDLNDLYDYGNVPFAGAESMVQGARFHRTTRKERKEARKKGEIPLNVLRYEKYDKGEVIVEAPNLLLDQLDIAGATTVTASPVVCKGLHLSAKYTPDDKKPISLEAGFDELTLRDCAIVSDKSIYSVNSLTLTTVRALLTNEAFGQTEKQDGLGAMFAAMLDPKHAQGVRLAFEQLLLLGVATSGGFFVQSIEVDGFAVQAGGTAEAYIDALRGSLSRLKKRIEEETHAAKEDSAHAATHEAAKARLEKQMEKAEAEIKKGQPHGSVVDIKSIRVTGVPGISDDPISLTDIHGQGTSVSPVVPLFGDPTFIRNMIRGKEAAPTVKNAVSGEEFSIDIGHIEAAKPLRIAGSIPTADLARKEFEEFEKDNRASRFKEGYEAVDQALKQRADDAKEYEILANKGIQNLTPAERARFRKVRKDLSDFEERRAAIIESFTAQGVTLGFSAEHPELAAESLSVKGIKTFTPDGRENLHIGEISGKGVSLSDTFTGGVANLKELREKFKRADFKARQLSIKDIRHKGSDLAIEEISFEGDAESKGLEVSLEPGDLKTGGATVGIKSRKVIAKGVSIPAHAAILRAERARILAIPEKDRLPEEKKRLDVIQDMLDDLDHIQGAKKEAEDVAGSSKSKKEQAAAQKQMAKSDQDLKNWQDRLVVNKLTIEYLDIAISNLGDALDPGYSFDKNAAEFAITGRGKEGHWFEQTELEGVRNRTAKGDQVIADRITVGPVGGKLKKARTGGYALEGFTVGSLAVRGVSYVSGDMKVQSIGESKLLGISIDATVEFPAGQTDLMLTRVVVERVVADNLRYEDADKVVTVVSGELIGLQLTKMHVVLPEDPKAKKTIEGDFSLDAIKSLALSGVAGGYQVDGTLNATKPKGEEAHTLTVNFAKSGEITVGLKGLSASADVTQLGTKNKVHIQWKNLGAGKFVKNGDNYTVTGLTIGDLTLSRMNWQVGGKTIMVNDKVTLTGISVDAEAALEPKKKGPATSPAKDAAAKKDEKGEEPEKRLSKLLLKKLRVDEIDAKDVEVTIPAVEEDKAKGIEFSPKKYFHLQEATINGLTVTGFDVLNMRGKVEVTKDVTVTNLRTVIGEVSRDNMKEATASFIIFGKDSDVAGKGGRELSATLTAKDGTIIRLGRTDYFTLTNIHTYQKKDGKKGKETTDTNVSEIKLPGITTGDLIIKDDSISISDIEVAGPVGISGVSWKVTGATTQTVLMESATLPEVLTIHKISAGFKKVPTGKIVDGKEEMRSELDTFTISGVSIPKLAATKLFYHGPLESDKGTKTVDLGMPMATIEGITINKLSKNFTDNLLSLDANLKSASLPGFTTVLTETVAGTTKTKQFGADIASGEIRANAIFKTTKPSTPDEKTELDSGYFELDSIGLRNITGTFSEPSKFSQTLTGKSGELKKIRTDKSRTTVGSAALHGINYRDPNLGLTVNVEELQVPQTTTIPDKGPFTIPEAIITDAYFHVDDILALKSGGSTGGSAKPIDTEQFYGILDHVNGHFKSDIYLDIYAFHIPVVGDRYVRQDVFPVEMVIRDGKFNYKDVVSKAVWLRNRALLSLQMDTDEEREVDGDLERDWSKSYLALEIVGKNVIEWTPSDQAERKEMTEGEVRLKRIIRPDDKETAEEKEKKEKERQESNTPERINKSTIEMRNVDANLGIRGYIPLDLGDYGRIALGTKSGDALTDLTLKSETTSKLLWSLNQMAVTIEELKFGDTTLKGDKPGGAEIVINKVEDGSLEFTNGKVMNPKALSGTIRNASVKNLAVDLGGKT